MISVLNNKKKKNRKSHRPLLRKLFRFFQRFFAIIEKTKRKISKKKKNLTSSVYRLDSKFHKIVLKMFWIGRKISGEQKRFAKSVHHNRTDTLVATVCRIRNRTVNSNYYRRTSNDFHTVFFLENFYISRNLFVYRGSDERDENVVIKSIISILHGVKERTNRLHRYNMSTDKNGTLFFFFIIIYAIKCNMSLSFFGVKKKKNQGKPFKE